MMQITVIEATMEELPALIALSEREFPEYVHDHDAITEIHRWTSNTVTFNILSPADSEGLALRSPLGRSRVGGGAVLFLNNKGLKALLDGTLPLDKPPMKCIAAPRESIEGVYVWMWVAHGHGVSSRAAAFKWMAERAPGVKVYGRPLTPILERMYSMYGAVRVQGTDLWVSDSASPLGFRSAPA